MEERRFGEVIQFLLPRKILGYEVYRTSSYYVDGLLIDTGFRHAAEDFFKTAARRRVDQIVITHHHEDHVGACHLFHKILGITPYAHERCIPLMENPPELKIYRRIIWGRPEPSEARPVAEVVKTGNFSFQVIHIPGHSEDQIGLLEPVEGWFFSSDLYLKERMEFMRPEEDAGQIMESLKRVLDLPLKVLFCSSGRVVNEPEKAILGKLRFLEELREKVHYLAEKGLSEIKIRDEILGKEGFFKFISGGEFSKLNLIKSLLKIG
ncbi:MAG: MBL fold metallo-hydrolase [Fidelibacterota bacterium]